MSHNRKEYLALKAAHKCTSCQKQDERTLAGFTLCEECRVINRDRNNARYRRLQREHKCTHCGKPLAEGEYFSCCASCRKKQSERAKEKQQKKKAAESGNSQTA